MRDPFDFADREYGKGPVLRPKPASSLILVKRGHGSARVLMGRRGAAHVFYPGRFVFPGGRVERADYRVPAADTLRPEVLARLVKGASESLARALALAAIRETYEEAGLLIGTPSAARIHVRAPAWRSFFAQGIAPAPGLLDFVARAITPPGRPRRFDARFFMADAEHIADARAQHDSDGELVDLAWLTFDEARAAEILPITLCVLDEIEARLSEGADPARPTPFFIPRRGKAVVLAL
jgi:8-oxo-dGTP pyrophosphatase MutT (NUDIX family)